MFAVSSLFKEYHKKTKFGKVRQVPIQPRSQGLSSYRLGRERPWERGWSQLENLVGNIPWLGFVSFYQIWDFYGYSLNTLIISKNGNPLFFPVACPNRKHAIVFITRRMKSYPILTSNAAYSIQQSLWANSLVVTNSKNTL